jgi:5-methylcytosine-specific restriction endonuclease McrA
MSPETPKRPRLRLEVEAYDQLRQQILERDGWRCQQCGRCTQLEVHHMYRRSRGGDDSEENLLTLCRACHRGAHRVGV